MDFLSKSVYQTSDTYRNEDKLKKFLELNQKNSPDLLKLSKYNLFIDKDHYVKYEVNKIFMDFEEYLNKLDYKYLTAPFITNTFHVQRKMAFQKLEKLTKNLPWEEKCSYMRKFIEAVDTKYLHQFKYKIKEPYVNLVFQKHYNIPKDLNINDVKKSEAVRELYNLSVIVAIWTIEIEVAADLIERANLYGLYKIPEERKEIIEKLKSEHKFQNKFTVRGFTKKILKRSVMMVLDKLSSNMVSKGFNFKSISWSACIGILYYIVGQSAFPWYFVVGSVNIPWICGGFLASKLLEKLGKKINRDEVLKDLMGLENIMNDNAIEMMEINNIIDTFIKKTYDNTSEKEFEFMKKSVEQKIETMLDYKKRQIDISGESKTQKSKLNDSRLSLDMLVVSEPDDPEGWVICEMQEFEQIEDDSMEDYVIY